MLTLVRAPFEACAAKTCFWEEIARVYRSWLWDLKASNGCVFVFSTYLQNDF